MIPTLGAARGRDVVRQRLQLRLFVGEGAQQRLVRDRPGDGLGDGLGDRLRDRFVGGLLGESSLGDALLKKK